ncbi:MAG: TrmH family RNA methyltransferase, partial [Candidatus Latescibacteria bacterium]|nr:TrmH family RNA methyltransferase [Candidatus Latescibacterota bacterium]
MRNKKGDMETSFEVRSFDADMNLEAYNKLPKLPLYFILDNLRSAFNVGSIFRACDILRVKGLFLCGYTAYPPHKKLEKTSLGTIDYVSWQYFKTTLEAVAHLQQRHVPVWAAETTSVSTLYTDMTYPHELGIVLGNEA